MSHARVTHAPIATVLATVVAAVCVSLARPARADNSLVVVPAEGGTWGEWVAMLRDMPRYPGLAFHVRVLESDTNRIVACGSYALGLDAASSRALRFGGCDPVSGATDVILIDGSALYDPRATVPTARYMWPTAQGPAEPLQPGVRCSGSVHPYVTDLADGSSVLLTPGRYVLEPLDSHVTASASTDGWNLTARSSTAVAEATFRVVDRTDSREVLRARVSLSCRADILRGDGSFANASFGPAQPPLRLPSNAVARGDSRGSPLARLSCTSTAAPTVVWRFRAPFDGLYEFWLQGGYDAALEVTPVDGEPSNTGCSNELSVRSHARVVMFLTRGREYDLHVSGDDGDAGRYEAAVLPIGGGSSSDVDLHAGP